MSEAKLSGKRLEDIKIFHAGIGIILLVESLIIWLLSSNFTLPVTTTYLESSSLDNTLIYTTKEIFRVKQPTFW